MENEISNTEAIKKLLFSTAAKWLGAIFLALTTGTTGIYYGQKQLTPDTQLEKPLLELQLPEGVEAGEFHKIGENLYVVVPIEKYWVGKVEGDKWEYKYVTSTE